MRNCVDYLLLIMPNMSNTSEGVMQLSNLHFVKCVGKKSSTVIKGTSLQDERKEKDDDDDSATTICESDDDLATMV